MAKKVQTTITFEGSAEHKLKAVNPAAREGMGEALKLRKKTYMPRHFRPGARSRYNHDARSPGYNRRKRGGRTVRDSDSAGQAIDLVWSGSLRDAMLNRSRIAVSKYKNPTGRIIYTGARVLNFSRLAGMPDMLREVNTDTQGELDNMLTVAHNVFTRRMAGVKKRKRIVA